MLFQHCVSISTLDYQVVSNFKNNTNNNDNTNNNNNNHIPPRDAENDALIELDSGVSFSSCKSFYINNQISIIIINYKA